MIVLLCAHKLLYGQPRTDWKKEHVLVTGGSQGLGLELAIACCARGANVTIVARNEAQLKVALEKIEAASYEGAKALAVKGDVTDTASLSRAVKQGFDKFGRVGTLIACAGSAATGMFVDHDDAVFAKQMDLNYLGVVKAVKAVVNPMIDHGYGSLILVSSALSLTGYAGYSAYAPTKWAVRGLCEVLLSELGPKGIKVHSVYPPNMDRPLRDHLLCSLADTPGFAFENSTKPEATKAIERGEGTYNPAVIAKGILDAVEFGEYHIPCGDPGIMLLTRAANGLAPRNTPIFDFFTLPLILVVGAVYRRIWEFKVSAEYAKGGK